MKKWIIAGFIILAIIITAYFLISSAQNINYLITINATESAVYRHIINKDKWQRWWPGEKKNDTIYSYKNCSYRIDKILFNGIVIHVFSNKDSVKGFLQFIYHGNEATQFQWTSTYIFSSTPLKRFSQYVQLKKIKNNIEDLLTDIKKYFDNAENVYGMKIIKQKVTESSMIAVKDTFNHYPATEEIYAMIKSVKEYINKSGGEESSFPMLNVYKEDSANYQAMVAIPTKTELPSTDTFKLKKMVLGNILMAEIKGGIHTITRGEEELKNYVNDYKKISPAIPFQSLVTDRLLQSDTSKWVTRLYYPIFQ